MPGANQLASFSKGLADKAGIGFEIRLPTMFPHRSGLDEHQDLSGPPKPCSGVLAPINAPLPRTGNDKHELPQEPTRRM